jgi:hypothetical protein
MFRRGIAKPERNGVASAARIVLVKCPLCSRSISHLLIDAHVTWGTCGRNRPVRKVGVSNQTSAFVCRSESAVPLWVETIWKTPEDSETCGKSDDDFKEIVTLRNFSGTVNRVVQLSAPASGDAVNVTLLMHVPPRCPSVRLSVSILKSALQKNVRLGRAAPAMRTAVALLRKSSFSELVRRILIVLCEDAHVLMDHFPALTWLTAALSRGYEPRSNDIFLALNAVGLACLVRVRDAEVLKDCIDDQSDAALSELDSWCQDGEPDLVTLVRSLQMRATYGGTQGDVAMLRRASRMWFRRFLEDPSTWRTRITESTQRALATLPPSLALSAVDSSSILKRGDIPLSAIDFHCSRVCYELARSVAAQGEASPVFERFGRDCLDGIERLMWEYSSSISSKASSWADEEFQEKICAATVFDRLLWEDHLQLGAKRFARNLLLKAGL